MSDVRAQALALETRICMNVMNLVASVQTFEKELQWDNSILLPLEYDGCRFVFDEMCEDLCSEEDYVIWAMTCIRLTCEKGHVVRIQPSSGWSMDDSLKIFEVACNIINLYGLEHDSGPPQDEDPDSTEIANVMANNVLELLKDITEDAAYQVYSGRPLYSYPSMS